MDSWQLESGKILLRFTQKVRNYIFKSASTHHHHHQLFKHGSPFSKAGLQGAMHLKYYKNFKRANNNESRQGKRT